MATFTRFEDIVAWQKAKRAAHGVYEVTSAGRFAGDYALPDQIRRACLSVMANIAEGHGRRSNKEFATFLNFAHGSVAETQSHLHIARELGYVSDQDFTALYGELDEVCRMIMKLSQHLRTTA